MSFKVSAYSGAPSATSTTLSTVTSPNALSELPVVLSDLYPRKAPGGGGSRHTSAADLNLSVSSKPPTQTMTTSKSVTSHTSATTSATPSGWCSQAGKGAVQAVKKLNNLAAVEKHSGWDGNIDGFKSAVQSRNLTGVQEYTDKIASIDTNATVHFGNGRKEELDTALWDFSKCLNGTETGRR